MTIWLPVTEATRPGSSATTTAREALGTRSPSPAAPRGDSVTRSGQAWGCGCEEAEVMDAGEGGQRSDEADVGTFGSFDGADASVVGRVHVANLEPGAIAGEAAGPEGGEAAFVGEFGQRVDLIHELAELAAA